MRGPLAYLCPGTLAEALEMLAELGPKAVLVAGGTDLLVDLREGKLHGLHLLDISRLGELRVLELRGEEVHLGAGITFSEILASGLLREHAPALVEAASSVGSVQIRNVATVGGNVIHCSPCADSVPALLVHQARAVLESRKGTRVVPLEALLLGPYKSGIGPGEILTGFVLKSSSGLWGTFQKVARRRELAIARLSLAVVARVERRAIREIRVALGSATPVPKRMEEVESYLLGKRPTERDLWEAGRILAGQMIAASGIRASTAYKEKAVQGLLVRTLYPVVNHGP